jgi:hypothetical protein
MSFECVHLQLQHENGENGHNCHNYAQDDQQQGEQNK